MRHLARILAVAVTLIAVAYSTAIATPAVQNLIVHHPAVAGYVAAVTSVLAAVWRAWTERVAASTSDSSTNTTGAPGMGAK